MQNFYLSVISKITTEKQPLGMWDKEYSSFMKKSSHDNLGQRGLTIPNV